MKLTWIGTMPREVVGIGLVVAEETGRFGLDIDFANVDGALSASGSMAALACIHLMRNCVTGCS